jgi:hypothetical protein
MTPYELSLYIEASQEREENERKEQLSLVWLGEYYHRTKRLPKLSEELKKFSSNRREIMTSEQMLETVKTLNTQFGGVTIKGGE